MKYYVYFDAYGHAKQIVTEKELADKYHNEPNKFLIAACQAPSPAERGPITGHVGTLCFDTEMELKKYLAGLGEEIEGFYGCRSESRPYNF
ncbi:MAG: hypothetical protein KJO34_17585 [Deltaproteobacteria bacterium]|nr:hypothetical protein [Deltaproteobacteria bacterium]